MATVKEQYDDMLDQLEAETKEQMISYVPFARVLEEVDPIAYRCGLADFEATCEECGESYWPDDHDAEALCEACVKAAAEGEADDAAEA